MALSDPAPRHATAARWRYTLALLLLCLAATAVLHGTRGWVHLGVPHFDPARTPFTDTNAHLQTAAACRHGLGTWHGSACFWPDADTLPRAQTYQPWLFLHDIGLLRHEQHAVVAWSTIVLFLLAFAAACAPRDAREFVLSVALVSTAGVQLCIERGNFDLLMFVLLVLAAAALARPGRAGFVLGTALLAGATALKLYVGAATAASWLVARRRHWTAAAIAAAGVALAVAIVGPAELLALRQGAPEGDTRFSTGVPWLLRHAGVPATLALLALAGAAVGAWLWSHRAPLRVALEALPPRHRIGLQLVALSAVPLFAIKASYDYRFVIWLPAAIALLKLGALRGGGVAGGVGVACFLLAAGMELPLAWIEPWTATDPRLDRIGAVPALLLLKQASAVVLATLVAGLALLALRAPAQGDASGPVAARWP